MGGKKKKKKKKSEAVVEELGGKTGEEAEEVEEVWQGQSLQHHQETTRQDADGVPLILLFVP